jgi:hypothetical protein
VWRHPRSVSQTSVEPGCLNGQACFGSASGVRGEFGIETRKYQRPLAAFYGDAARSNNFMGLGTGPRSNRSIPEKGIRAPRRTRLDYGPLEREWSVAGPGVRREKVSWASWPSAATNVAADAYTRTTNDHLCFLSKRS